MNIKLFVNNSEQNKIYKNIEYINDVSGELRVPTNILTPIIDIELNDYKSLTKVIDVVYVDNSNEYDIAYTDDGNEYEVDIYTDNEKIFSVNYVYIDEFERYYYVTNIDCLSNKLFRLYLNVDVLMSHKEKFMLLDAVIERNEFDYDDTLEDLLQKYEYYQNVDYIEGNTDWLVKPIRFDNPTDRCYGITYYAESTADYEPVTNNVYMGGDVGFINSNESGANNFRFTGLTDVDSVNRLANYLFTHESDATFIISLIAFPFNVPSTYWNNLKLGTNILTNPFVYIYMIDDLYSNAYGRELCMYDFTSESGYNWDDYTMYEPYTKYEIYLPYYGYIELKSTDIKNSFLVVYYSVDLSSGLTRINIYNSTIGRTIKSVTTSMGVQIGISRSNQQQIQDSKNQLAIKSAIGGIGSTASIVGGIFAMNPLMVGGGLVGLGTTIGNTITSLNALHENASVQSSGGSDGLFAPQTSHFKITKSVKKEVTDYNKYYGKPLMQTKILSTLSGYTKVSEIHLENIDAMKDEITNIETLLKNGVII